MTSVRNRSVAHGSPTDANLAKPSAKAAAMVAETATAGNFINSKKDKIKLFKNKTDNDFNVFRFCLIMRSTQNLQLNKSKLLNL